MGEVVHRGFMTCAIASRYQLCTGGTGKGWKSKPNSLTSPLIWGTFAPYPRITIFI